MRISAKYKHILLSLFLIISSAFFFRTTFTLYKHVRRLEDLEQEVKDLYNKKTMLEESVAYKESDEYIEESARNDLSLIKPGEDVFVVRGLEGDSKESFVLSAVSNHRSKVNLYLWYKLFF